MKKILFVFILFTSLGFSQELKLNENTNIYEFSKVYEINSPSDEVVKNLISNFKNLNYTNIISEEDRISAESFYSKLIMGTTLQVKYQVIYEFKDDKYRLLINKFIVDDKRWSPIPLENLKSHTKRWIKDINQNLPIIVKALESSPEKW